MLSQTVRLNIAGIRRESIVENQIELTKDAKEFEVPAISPKFGIIKIILIISAIVQIFTMVENNDALVFISCIYTLVLVRYAFHNESRLLDKFWSYVKRISLTQNLMMEKEIYAKGKMYLEKLQKRLETCNDKKAKLNEMAVELGLTSGILVDIGSQNKEIVESMNLLIQRIAVQDLTEVMLKRIEDKNIGETQSLLIEFDSIPGITVKKKALEDEIAFIGEDFFGILMLFAELMDENNDDRDKFFELDYHLLKERLLTNRK